MKDITKLNKAIKGFYEQLDSQELESLFRLLAKIGTYYLPLNIEDGEGSRYLREHLAVFMLFNQYMNENFPIINKVKRVRFSSSDCLKARKAAHAKVFSVKSSAKFFGETDRRIYEAKQLFKGEHKDLEKGKKLQYHYDEALKNFDEHKELRKEALVEGVTIDTMHLKKFKSYRDVFREDGKTFKAITDEIIRKKLSGFTTDYYIQLESVSCKLSNVFPKQKHCDNCSADMYEI